MEFRRANRGDIDLLVKNRIEFVSSIREIRNIEDFKNKTKEYIIDNIDGNNLVIFIAADKNRIVSSCMASLFRTLPKPSCPNGISAELLNVYTLKEYRRNGYAEKILNMLIKETKKLGVEKIILDYTDMGLHLYKKLGFTEVCNQMQLKL